LLKISATAGSGKTHVLVECIKALKPRHGKFLAYNKKVAIEAEVKLQDTNVEASTIHSLAYQAVMKNNNKPINNKKRFLGSFREHDIGRAFPNLDKISRIRLVIAMTKFFLSKHITFPEFAAEADSNLPEHLVKVGRDYMKQMLTGHRPCSHDFYLKLYHILLATGELIPAEEDVLLIDECVPGTTKIRTNCSKPVNISQLFKMQEAGKELPLAKSFNTKTSKFEYKKINEVFSNGKKMTYKVETNTKISLRATAKHKVLTQRGYVCIEDLVPYVDCILSDSIDNLRIHNFLNKDQQQIIIGSILGDGCLIQEKTNFNAYSMKFTHGYKQLDYMKWKMSAFNMDESGIHCMTSGYTGKKNIYQSSQVDSFILDDDRWNYVIKNIDILGLAIWIMDDGSFNKDNGTFLISSNSYTKQENEILSQVINDKFNIEAVVRSAGRGYWGLSLNRISTKKLFDLVMSSLHPIFIEKWGISEVCSKEPIVESEYPRYGGAIVSTIEQYKIEQVYDLNIEDNHNYIITMNSYNPKAAGLLVHNCGDINAVSLEIFKHYPAQKKIMAGDQFQNIYTFNHTINGFDELKGVGTTVSLTNSYRVEKSIAQKIQWFCQEYIDSSMVFEGIEIEDKTIKTEMYITRTNATLIGKMIELNAAKKPYTLAREANRIFELPMILLSLRPGRAVGSESYKFLEHEANEWGSSPLLRQTYPKLMGYIASKHSHDIGVKSAISLVATYGAPALFEAKRIAKLHEEASSPHNIVCGTAFSLKGQEADCVYIADDLNDSVEKVLKKPKYSRTKDDETQLLLYYVACSRAQKKLIGARHLPLGNT
jgi:hypothetical protein